MEASENDREQFDQFFLPAQRVACLRPASLTLTGGRAPGKHPSRPHRQLHRHSSHRRGPLPRTHKAGLSATHSLSPPWVGDGRPQQAREPVCTLPLDTPKPLVLAGEDPKTWNASPLPNKAPGPKLGFVTKSGATVLDLPHPSAATACPRGASSLTQRSRQTPTEEAESPNQENQARRRRTQVVATYFSCLALSFFGLQWVEKEKRTKQRGVQMAMPVTILI